VKSAGGWAAYAEAIVYFAAPEGTMRVEPYPLGHAGVLPGAAREALYIVTAWNPDGSDRDARDNARAQATLEQELTRAGLEYWTAAGGDPAWSHVEASVAVIGIDRATALALGRRYRQEAIFELTPRFRSPSQVARAGKSGRIEVMAACARCDRPYRPHLPDVENWNMVLRDGRITGIVCPGCQAAEEDLEAQVNQTVLSYQADDQGRIWNRLKGSG
jgi:Protein of unknown function (DUF3293)